MSPQILEEAIRRVDFDRELVFKFFVGFSLFEKALKETDFHKERSDPEKIEPDWREFATKIKDRFTTICNLPDNKELAIAVNYLLSNPPKKQVFRDGHIQFVSTGRSSNSDTEWLTVLINRIRNNLFHGAKFSYEHPRDTDLLHYSLIILEEWSTLNPDIKRVLEEVR